MKTMRHCKTTWAAISLPLVGWAIQHWNGGLFTGGMLPMPVQTWGPLGVAIGIILLRRATNEPCRCCGK